MFYTKICVGLLFSRPFRYLQEGAVHLVGGCLQRVHPNPIRGCAARLQSNSAAQCIIRALKGCNVVDFAYMGGGAGAPGQSIRRLLMKHISLR